MTGSRITLAIYSINTETVIPIRGFISVSRDLEVFQEVNDHMIAEDVYACQIFFNIQDIIKSGWSLSGLVGHLRGLGIK